MEERKVINPLSTTALPIKMFCDKNLLAIGTGFFYRYNDKNYFITAGHNITGTNPETNENIGIPNKIIIYLHRQASQADAINGFIEHEVHLADENGIEIWLEHPIYGRKVDVVAFPVEIPSNALIKPINEIKFDRIQMEMGMDLFILGYPYGYFSDPHILPIWKRGSLATEYSINIENEPKFYIDSATAKGMSGAPVVAQKTALYVPDGDPQPINTLVRTGGCFVGIYTGRLGIWDSSKSETKPKNDYDIFDAQIGIVWRNNVIEEIIKQKTNE